MAEWDWHKQIKKKRKFEGKTRIQCVPFYPEPIHLKPSKWEHCHDLPHPSVVTLVFCHRSSENPLPLSFDLFPNLHFHFTSALLPPPPLTTCCSLLSQDVKSPLSFWFMTSVMWVCMCSVSIYPAVHVAFDVRDKLVFKKVWPLLLPFPMSFICRICTFFCSGFFFVLFCPC